MWYVAQACMALNIDMNEVLDINIKKLSKRYPAGLLMLTSLKIAQLMTDE